MKYDFDTPINRKDTNSLKWDVAENELPMWVADMDFETAPKVQEAIRKRASHGAFGYSVVSDEWNRAYIGWWERRHAFTIQSDWLIFCTGVVPAISSTVRKLTTPAEKVLIQTPVYNIFFNSIINNGRQVLESSLKYNDGKYEIDFEDLEQKLSDTQTSLMILCNPHNPVGKIWDKETLERIGELCWQYHVVVLSDEIHCDLTDPGTEYIPFASVSEKCRENSITCIAPTKAFNLAGMQTAAVMIPNGTLRHKVWRALNTDEVAEPNAFAVDAAIAAFSEGEDWLDELRTYIFENKKRTVEFVRENIPQIRVVPSNATYLLWLDCSKIPGTASEIADYIRKKTGLYLSEGSQFGSCGEKFLRMNIACPRITLEDGLERLRKGIGEMKKLGFGLMRMPLLDKTNATDVDVEQVKKMVDLFIEKGFTYFDTAWMYNGFASESVAKTVLVDRYPRDSFTLATKLHAAFFNSPEEREKVFSAQLEKTGAGYFDYYLLHGIESDMLPKYEKFDCFNWLLQKKEQGLVKHVGFSYHDTPKLLDEILTKHPEMEFVQLQVNYLDWESEWVHSRACYEVAVKHNKPVIVMEPVKGGTLARVPEEVENLFKGHDPNMSIPSWAIRFAASLDNVMVVLSGMSSVEQMEDNLSYMEDFKPLTEEEKALCHKAADVINAQIAVPCTGCSYCTEGCPKKIAIPQYFSLYNEDMREHLEEKGWTINFTNYDILAGKFGRAKECVECGQCEGVCPQHLPIIKNLKEVSAHFDA